MEAVFLELFQGFCCQILSSDPDVGHWSSDMSSNISGFNGGLKFILLM